MKTRESFLRRACTAMIPLFESKGLTLPETIQVSVGFPSKRPTALRSKCIGECWHQDHQEGTAHIFISPLLASPVEALETLLHELLHSALPVGTKHGPIFARQAKRLGLDGKPTATTASPTLAKWLDKLSQKLGGYPHSQIKVETPKPKGSRLLKVLCEDCGYNVRVTRIWIDKLGCPICPGCNESMVEDGKETQPPTLELSLKYATSTARS